MGNGQEMVKQAKILTRATSALINAIKMRADAEVDLDSRQHLLDATKPLVDATSKMTETATEVARYPYNWQAQEALCRAAVHLR